MKDERIIELVNGELDGTISPSEKTELTTLLHQEPSAKTFFEEMERLDQLLASVPMADPPPGLKSNIMNAIAYTEASIRTTSESWLDRLIAPFVQRPAWAAVYTFAIGVIVGIGVLTLIETGGPEAGEVQGTIAKLTPPAVATLQVDAGPATADLLVSELEDELRIDITISSPDPVILKLTPAGSDPIVIEATSGSPAYSLIIPESSTLDVELGADDVFVRKLVTIRDQSEE